MKQFLKVDEVAEILQITAEAVRNYIHRGQLDAIKIGKEYRISPEAVNEYVLSCQVTKPVRQAKRPIRRRTQVNTPEKLTMRIFEEG